MAVPTTGPVHGLSVEDVLGELAPGIPGVPPIALDTQCGR